MAREVGAEFYAHGATGKGNDQCRFQLAAEALNPAVQIIAPWRIERYRAAFPGRTAMIDYCAKKNIPVKASVSKPYSSDENCLHISYEAGKLEELTTNGVELVEFGMCVTPMAAPDKPETITIDFESGVPVALNGQRKTALEMVKELNTIGGRHGVGIIDMVENRRVGIKSREVYECPGMLALILAHADLESITLERDVMREKSRLETRWAETVYDGLWYSPLREAFDAFVDSTQKHVTGEVRLRLQPGQCTVVGRRAEKGLYDYTLATYEADDAFRHEDAAGFVRLWGLSVETWSKIQRSEEPGVPSP